ncbi:class I SAM-dependent methyltransferase [Actinomycetospora lutea]|uniref:class I SAM-dependent methyltransferase n=1 Tax=Actinomycetospora lutea TaxID=663604 RepID=UPI0023659E07|nr:class I SAM-dependent methyltransferase [Actinomycetospora lutea]MDD7937437.1 class I SAM-dependent methyltransferase [Actinomycetospora lutea]
MDAQAEQTAAWNGTGGDAWVRLQPLLDATYAPVEELLVGRVAAAAGGSSPTVLDVGCGTGATTLALARRLGPSARCVGVDLSEPMIELARRRAGDGAVEFLVADAGRHPFAPGGADVIASRFGVMFFDDPVAAFANLRAATRPGGALRAVVWRTPRENPFMTRAGEAAPPLLEVPPWVPDAPGPFALADPDRTLGLLRAAGWATATADPVDLPCGFAERDLDDYVGTMGPVGRALAGRDAATRAQVLEHVRPAFDEFRSEGEIRFTAKCWLLWAQA